MRRLSLSLSLMVVSVLFVFWQLDFLQWEAAKPLKKSLSPVSDLVDVAKKNYQRVTLPAGASTPLSDELVNEELKGKLLNEVELVVSAKDGVLNSGYKICSGDWFRLERLSGQWSAGQNKGNRILEDKAADCLMASLYMDNWFVVEDSGSWREAAIDGELRLTINEKMDGLADNSGQVKVRLTVVGQKTR